MPIRYRYWDTALMMNKVIVEVSYIPHWRDFASLNKDKKYKSATQGTIP